MPEYIHSVELGCKFQNDEITILPSIYYRYTYNRFTSVTEVFGDSSYTTRQNLSNDQSAGVEFITSATFNDLLTSHASVNVFKNTIDASNLGYSSDKSTVTWSGALTVSIHATSSTMLQLNSTYNSARLTPQGEYAPSYVVNIGLRQELIEGKLSLTVTIADLFKTLKRETEVNTSVLKQTMINTRDSRVFSVSLTYNFGAPPKKSQKEESLKYDNGL